MRVNWTKTNRARRPWHKLSFTKPTEVVRPIIEWAEESARGDYMLHVCSWGSWSGYAVCALENDDDVLEFMLRFPESTYDGRLHRGKVILAS